MDTHVDMAPGREAGSEPEGPAQPRLRYVVPAIVAALVLAPGIILGAPIKHAFSNFVTGLQNGDAPDEIEAVDSSLWLDVKAENPADLFIRIVGGARAIPVSWSVPLAAPGSPGFLRVADAQADDATFEDASAALADMQAETSGTPPTPAVETQASGGSSSLGGPGSGFGGRFNSGSSGFSGAGIGGGGGGDGGGSSAGGGGGGSSAGGVDSSLADAVASTDGSDPDGSLLDASASAVAGVPEPSSWAILILGFGGAGAMVRRRRARQLD
jgi:hypothetical protein